MVPVSDRMLNLVEAPQGATALLTGLRRQREGDPLNVLVRPYELCCFLYIDLHHLCQEDALANAPMPAPLGCFPQKSPNYNFLPFHSYLQVPAMSARRVMGALELNKWTLEVRHVFA